jgi:LacI family transcriptional regulator
VPDDIALAGFDDIPTARFTQPPLTTVRVRIADLGGRALDQLVATIANGGSAQAHSVQMLAPELVLRASCGMHSHAAAAPTHNPDTVSKKRAQAGPAVQGKPQAAPRHR